MRFLVTCLLVGIAVLATGCRKAPRDVMSPVLPAHRVYTDDGPAFRDSLRLVVRDMNSWNEVWNQATSTQAAPVPLPAIDFGREMIVVVAAGRMTPGDVIRVDSVGTQGSGLVVVVRTIAECRAFSAEAYPLEIVRVRRSDGPVSFIERRDRAGECR
jgi:hypothetical protein